MLDCKQTSQLISQSLDRSLTVRERFAMRLHLLVCQYCKQFSQHMQTLRVAFKTIVSTVESDNSIEMPSTTKSRILRSIESIKD